MKRPRHIRRVVWKATIGPVAPDPIGVILHTGFVRFASPFGINGLVRWTEWDVEFLAFAADRPGNGALRALLTQCKRLFRVIRVWSVTNPWLPSVLERYGFKPVRRPDGLAGFEWRKSDGANT